MKTCVLWSEGMKDEERPLDTTPEGYKKDPNLYHPSKYNSEAERDKAMGGFFFCKDCGRLVSPQGIAHRPEGAATDLCPDCAGYGFRRWKLRPANTYDSVGFEYDHSRDKN